MLRYVLVFLAMLLTQIIMNLIWPSIDQSFFNIIVYLFFTAFFSGLINTSKTEKNNS